MSVTPERRRRKRSTIIRLAIASIALAGIGAAATAAAWTTQTTFTAGAKAASIELYGALAVGGTCPAASRSVYAEADNRAGAVAITLNSGEFAALTPGQERSVKICLWNGGDLDLAVTLAPIAVSTNSIFGGANPATITVRNGTAAYARTVLTANQVVPLSVVVTTPAVWASSYQGQSSGAVEIVFTGSTDVP